MNKLELASRVCKWLDDTLRIIGLVAVIMFVRVNWFGASIMFQIPNTPVFANVVLNQELEEYLEVTKPIAPVSKK